MVVHDFTKIIICQIENLLNIDGMEVLQVSPLLEYINIKTKSANRGSKARGSFANLYAMYVLVEDYIKVVFDNGKEYKDYEGAVFSDLFTRQRELPFGDKLQNQALNHRLNQEFHKYFPVIQEAVIIRDVSTNQEENLKLYKTGRTNANDGGIDFVMKPLGNFYQVTETLNVRKYFLDIDKLEHYPVKFVIKTNESVEDILKYIRENAIQQYGIEVIVERYMKSIDEVINIPMLILYLNEVDKHGYLDKVLDEIIIQSKVEFNYEDNTPVR